MARLPANWLATGGGPSGHGSSAGGGNFKYDGINQNNLENAVNKIPAKGVATVVATTPQIGTYNQPGGASVGVGATFTYGATGVTVIDGYTLTSVDRVLLVAQAAAAQNGLFDVTTPGTTGVATILTRAPEMNSSADFPGAIVLTSGAGNIYKGTAWICGATGTPVIGSAALPFGPPEVKKRITTINDPTALSLNTDTFDVCKVTNIGTSLTLGTGLPVTVSGGSPGDMDPMTLVFMDAGGAQQLFWDLTKFTNFGIVGTLPGNTPGSGKKMTMNFLYDADRSQWALTAVDITGY
jgi:hypothetical protein